MLSYKHGFHAGNHADVLKHLILTFTLNYLKQKEKPFLYIDTHAGSGLYSLRSSEALKNKEYETGIQTLWDLRDPSTRDLSEPAGSFEFKTLSKDSSKALSDYLDVVQAYNPSGILENYPGSACIAATMLRPRDRAFLCELHPHEFTALDCCLKEQAKFSSEPFEDSRKKWPSMTAQKSDGFAALKALLPPPEKRALILIDPPYEVKTDYQSLIDALTEAHRRFPIGIYLIWYPLLHREEVSLLQQNLMSCGFEKTITAELQIKPSNADFGLVGSGMAVMNPPYPLAGCLAEVLPYLVQQLAPEGGTHRLLVKQ